MDSGFDNVKVYTSYDGCGVADCTISIYQRNVSNFDNLIQQMTVNPNSYIPTMP